MKLVVCFIGILVSNDSTSYDTIFSSHSISGIENNIWGDFAYYQRNIGFYTKVSNNPVK